MPAFNHRDGHRFEVDGAQLYVEVQGRDTDPPLVLLHGGLGTLADFNALLPHLSQPWRLIGIDTRGHGASTLGPLGLSYQRMQQDAERITEHLGLAQFDVIGFSDGGITALRMAASPRSRIRRLVAIGTHVALPADGDPIRDIYRRVTPESWRAKFPQTYEAYQSLNPAPDLDALVKAALVAWQDPGEQGYPQDNVRGIGCEVMVVRGDEDHLVSREHTADLLARLPKAVFLNVPFAGHVAYEDQPELVMLGVNQFLAGKAAKAP